MLARALDRALATLERHERMNAPLAVRTRPLDWARVRADFPLLTREVHGKPLIYFDSANTGQKPQSVIEAVDDFYRHHNANVSRAVHTLGTEATDAYEGARDKLARFLNVRARRTGAVQRHDLRDQPGRILLGVAAPERPATPSW